MSCRVSSFLITGFLLALQVSATHASVIGLDTGISFQDSDSGTWQTQKDDTAKLKSLDNDWAPSKPVNTSTGGVGADYYATGAAGFYFDAVSLSFDLSSVGFANVTGATLRFYTQKGDYATIDGTQPFDNDRNAWEHYQVLEGAFNTTNEDFGPTNPGIVGTLVDFGGAGVLNPNFTVGWLEQSIDINWITSNSFDVTLRLWNARIDAVELSVTTANGIPEPSTLAVLLLGLSGVGFATRRTRRTI